MSGTPEIPAEQAALEEVATVPSNQESVNNADGVSYIEAILLAVEGGRVRRSGWKAGIYVFVEDAVRIMKCTEGGHLPNGAIIDKFTPNVKDVLAQDWLLLPRPNCTFQEAVAAMEQGQHVRRDSWTVHIQIKDGKFCDLDDSQQEYTMRYEDICASDWEIPFMK
jgi:hypothetical protein